MVEQKTKSQLPLVLLHGWGFDHRIWDELIALLQPKIDCIALDLPGFVPGDAPVADLHAATDKLLAQLPPRCVLLGWSLGGMLATHLAIHHPERIAALITVGSNLKWVSDSDSKNPWPGASAENFAAFFENLAQNFSGTQQHFCGVIARGDKNEKTQTRLLRNKLASVSQENFLAGLRLLDSIDNRAGYAGFKVPGLHIFGEQDVMVPLAVAERMRKAQQQTLLIEGAAHQPFLSEPQLFADHVITFIKSVPYQLNKNQIALSFSKAAQTYDSAAQLQREIGDNLFAQLSQAQIQPQRALGQPLRRRRRPGTAGQQPGLLRRDPGAFKCYLVDVSPGQPGPGRVVHGFR